MFDPSVMVRARGVEVVVVVPMVPDIAELDLDVEDLGAFEALVETVAHGRVGREE